MKEERYFLVPLSLFVLLFLFLCSKMSPLYPVNDWSDINVYFNTAKAMLHGRTLYSEVFDHKGPLLFFIYALGAVISSDSYLGMFIIQTICWLIFTFSIYFTARIFLSPIYAILVSALTSYFCLYFIWMGGSAEEFILTSEGVSLYFFFNYFKAKQIEHPTKYMFVHSIMFTAVFFIKLSIILFWFFPIIFIFINLLFQRKYKNLVYNILALLAGVMLVSFPIIFYFWAKDALDTAYHVYIELNKQYSSSDDYIYLFTNGLNKLYTTTRENLPLMLLCFAGIFYTPFCTVSNKMAAVSLSLSGCSLIIVIFFNLTYHFYYPLVLLIFVAMGLISLMDYLSQKINLSQNKTFITSILTMILVICIGHCNFFLMGTAELLRLTQPSGPQFVFKNKLEEVQEPTLLNVGFGEGNALFTTAKITPTVKYFFCPNIYYNMYPDIRDSQTRYIENKEIDFVISSTRGFNYEYFENLDALNQNYAKIDSIVSRGAKYYLYKKKDND